MPTVTLNPISTISDNGGSSIWQTDTVPIGQEWEKIVKPLDPYPPSDSPWTRCNHGDNGYLDIGLYEYGYKPFTSVTAYFQYRKYELDANGATAADEGNDRTLQFELYVDDVLAFSSVVYTTTLTTATVAVPIPLNSFSNGWGVLKVRFIAGGSTGGGGATKRAPVVSWFLLTADFDTAESSLPVAPNDEVLTAIDVAWRADETTWGHDQVVHLPVTPGTADATQLVQWYFKTAGTYNLSVIKVKRRNLYMRVGYVPIHMAYFTISGAVDQVDTFTMTVFTEVITWVYSTGDNYADVLDFFIGELQIRGIDAHRDISRIYVIGELSRFVSFAVTAGTSYFLYDEHLPIQYTIKNEEDISAWSTPRDFTTA